MVVIPVSPDAHGAYANEVADILKSHGIRISVDSRNEKLGYRVREAQMSKIPVELVVGEGEIQDRAVTVRRYGKKEAVKMSLEDFIKAASEEIRNRK
jgi:threonyl-tRNA synthetase